MYVRVGKNGYRLIRNLVALDEPMLHAFEVYAKESSPTQLDVDAPYAAWKHVYGLLYRKTFSARGKVKSQTMFTTLRRITRELNYIDTHPALQGMAMLEWQADVIPAWKQEPDEQGRIYNPYPQPGHQFVILAPDWTRVPGQSRVTRWVERPSAPGALGREETHLVLQRHPVL